MLFVDGGGEKILLAIELHNLYISDLANPIYIFYGLLYQITHRISEFGIQLIYYIRLILVYKMYTGLNLLIQIRYIFSILVYNPVIKMKTKNWYLSCRSYDIIIRITLNNLQPSTYGQKITHPPHKPLPGTNDYHKIFNDDELRSLK